MKRTKIVRAKGSKKKSKKICGKMKLGRKQTFAKKLR